MKKLKVSYIRTQFWFKLKSGGSVAHTLGVLDGFKKNQCDLFILSNEKFLGIDKFSYKIIKPKFFNRRLRSLGELLYNFYAAYKIKKEIIKFGPDFIYHRYTGMTFFITKIAKKLNIPIILEFNSFDTWKIKYWGKSKNFFKKIIKSYLLYNIVKAIEIYNLRNASLIVTVSEQLKTDLLKKGISNEKILVNPNGVDQRKFNPNIIKSKICKKIKENLKIEENKIIVGFSGTFGLWHGIPQLTKAIIKILSNKLSDNIHFLIIGDGLLKSDMERQIGHYKEVSFVGEVNYSKVQYYLAICDILVSPHCPQIDGNEFFGSPTKLFEYMAMGKGIVASSLGQIGKILKDRKTAILVEPENVDQLTNGILELASDPILCKELGENAYLEVLEKYTWDHNIKNLLFAIEKQ